MRLTTSGVARHFTDEIVGRVTTKDLQPSDRGSYVRLFAQGAYQTNDLVGYRAILSHDDLTADLPVIDRLRESDHFRDDDVVVLEARHGFVRSLYRPLEHHHSLFVTERCSSNCLMCSQPPKDKDDVGFLTRRNQELIRLMDPAPGYLTITGGEPTLLGDHLFRLLEQLKVSLPKTELHILTNGRTLAWPQYTGRLAAVNHPNLCLGVPLYSDCAGDHDHVVQAKGAFDQTVTGLHQAARHGIRTEIRVVLHRLTIPRLNRLVEYIHRNLSFVEHVALMGLEYVGYTPRNIGELWIDPFDYQGELESAVRYLAIRDIPVSIYNHQLCVLRASLWPHARKSISDWKNMYLPECESCGALDQCGGLFKWAAKKHSEHIHPVPFALASNTKSGESKGTFLRVNG
jgi:His-Xaa-Ser system radical SAM maturase HxsC